MQRIKLSENLSFSRVVLGLWRLNSWNMDAKELGEYLDKAISFGVTTIDNANIYGGGKCEELLGETLSIRPDLRSKIEIVTKCDIVANWMNDKTGLCGSYYDTSYDYIIKCAKESLERMKCDYIDVFLLHRLDHLMDAKEVARAFNDLRKMGLVKHFGVSNFLIPQLNLLKKYYPEIVTNQIEMSVLELKHFKDGSTEYSLEKDVSLMAYSPLAGGKLFTEDNEQITRIKESLERVKKEVNADSIDQVAYAFLYKHPANIMPIVGSGKIERLEAAIKALDIKLTNKQWYDIFAHSQGHPVP